MTPEYSRVRSLFLELVELPSTQWDAVLKDRCEGDAGLESEVRRLLEHHQTDTLLENRRAKSANTTRIGPPKMIVGDSRISQPDPWLPLSAIIRLVRNSISSTRGVAWLFCTALALLLITVSYCVEQSIRASTKTAVYATLKTMNDQQAAAVEMRLEAEFRLARVWASLPDVVERVQSLIAISTQPGATPDSIREASVSIRERMVQIGGPVEKFRFAVWDRTYRLVAYSDPTSTYVGNGVTDYGAKVLSRVFRGEDMLWVPSSRGYIMEGFQPNPKLPPRKMSFLVPVYASEFKEPIAALMIEGEDMQERFDHVMALGRVGETGETYAVDEVGYLMSHSRFEEHLVSVGLQNPAANALTSPVRVARPSVNTYNESILDLDDRSNWPLTLAAQRVTNMDDGSNLDGYLDYRGVSVIGAWSWVDRYSFGIINEVDYDAAFRSLGILRRTWLSLVALCGFAGIASVLHWLHLERNARSGALENEIGPYLIERRLGEGGLATVDLATHSLLKRPTALKRLKPQHVNAKNLLRFEREVQLASRLNHPNTIEIYDYGRTPRGNFYCAMEYVDGVTLQALLDADGAQPVARVIHILAEICRSLREAHSCGLIHRDIKPQNIMIGVRAGEYDCVKVLDFGIAREIDNSMNMATDTRVLIGTPMFIPPERILDPTIIDPRSDIFALGIVGHLLLVGRNPFAFTDSHGALAMTMRTEPALPSNFTTVPIPRKLDDLVCRCQARFPDDRPNSVGEILELLEELRTTHPWTQQQARHWWELHENLNGPDESGGRL